MAGAPDSTIDTKRVFDALNQIDALILQLGFGSPGDRMNLIAYLMAANALAIARVPDCPLSADQLAGNMLALTERHMLPELSRFEAKLKVGTTTAGRVH